MIDKTVVTLAKIMKSFGHPIRLKIICLLVDGGQTVGQIHEQLSTSFANVSQHLQRLQNQGLVVADKDANFVFYSIASPKVAEMIRNLRRIYCAPSIDDENVKPHTPQPIRNEP